MRKEGPAFDLPIALAVLAASGIVSQEGLEGVGVVGELSLGGGLRGVRGALSMAEGARREGLETLILPEQNAFEAASIGGPSVYGVRSLKEAVGFIAGQHDVAPTRPRADRQRAEEPVDDFADVAGQRYAKRALEVTAAGGHNILMRRQPAVALSKRTSRVPSASSRARKVSSGRFCPLDDEGCAAVE